MPLRHQSPEEILIHYLNDKINEPDAKRNAVYGTQGLNGEFLRTIRIHLRSKFVHQLFDLSVLLGRFGSKELTGSLLASLSRSSTVRALAQRTAEHRCNAL